MSRPKSTTSGIPMSPPSSTIVRPWRRKWRSDPQMPQASVRTSTWPNAGTGSATSSTTRPPSRITTALTAVKLTSRPMPDFSLDLNEDQIQIQKWVHDFAEDVVRPAGHEWDEREETPWPIIEQAAEVGLYSFDFIANIFGDPTGLTVPIVMEEMCWGDAGIALSVFGTVLGV